AGRRHGDDRYPRQLGVLLLLMPQLPPVHARHHQIEHDELWRRRQAQVLHRLPSSGHTSHSESLVAKERGQCVPRAGIIVHDQDLRLHVDVLVPAMAALSIGSTIEKVAPCPARLATVISPPMASTSCRVIHSPRPNPPYCRRDTPRSYRANRRSCCSGAIPIPWSCTDSRATR